MSREQLRSRALYAAVNLFLEQGYQRTALDQIAQRVGRTKGAVLHVYPDKEAILYDLVTHMFGFQFGNVRKLLGEGADPLLVYGVETALQLHICELSGSLRDVYVSAYTLPSTSEYIYQNAAKELHCGELVAVGTLNIDGAATVATGATVKNLTCRDADTVILYAQWTEAPVEGGTGGEGTDEGAAA